MKKRFSDTLCSRFYISFLNCSSESNRLAVFERNIISGILALMFFSHSIFASGFFLLFDSKITDTDETDKEFFDLLFFTCSCKN